jgi:hypothetical protein
MILTNPISIDNITYDRINVNLATSALYDPTGNLSVSLVIRAVPVALSETLDPETGDAVLASADSSAASICVSTGDTNQSETDNQALETIKTAIEQILRARGL